MSEHRGCSSNILNLRVINRGLMRGDSASGVLACMVACRVQQANKIYSVETVTNKGGAGAQFGLHKAPPVSVRLDKMKRHTTQMQETRRQLLFI